MLIAFFILSFVCQVYQDREYFGVPLSKSIVIGVQFLNQNINMW